MSGRKRTKRKNSDEDFDVDEGDDDLDTDDINKWACHSCTVVNRAAAFRCFVCGTRKGTSTRRSRCNDNVVEMQKSITDLVQKQVEKEKSLKRKERTMLKSVTRDEGETSTDIKNEELSFQDIITKIEISETPISTDALFAIPTPETTPSRTLKTEPSDELLNVPPVMKVTKEKRNSPIQKKSPKLSRESTPYKKGTSIKTLTPVVTPEKAIEKLTPEKSISEEQTPISSRAPSAMSITGSTLISNPIGFPSQSTARASDIKIEVTPDLQPVSSFVSAPSMPATVRNLQTAYTPEVSKVFVPEETRTTQPSEETILNHLPERVIKKLNHHLPFDYELLKAHKMITGIDPIVAESEAVLLPHDWDRHKVMRGLTSSLGSSHNVSPTTSRQSSETDSSSSDGNRSFETLLNDSPSSVSKSCQIPDYMIHRESPRKIIIVANGFPAVFEEFPRRLQ